MELLIKKHTNLHDKIDKIEMEYNQYKVKLNEALNAIFFLKEERLETIKIIEKKLKKLAKEYSNTREEIYSIEDKIAEIDEEILNDIIRPLPEEI